MKKLVVALAFLALLAPVASCIIVTDDCNDGSLRCDGEVLDECVGGSWRILEDCYDLCGGLCDFDAYGDPVCIC